MRPSWEAFDVASYGKQLGLITERLRDLSRRGGGTPSAQAAEAQDKRVEIARRIEAIKAQECARDANALERHPRGARRRGGDGFERLASRLRALLQAPPSR